VQHFGREEHVLQGTIVFFINIIIFARILIGLFIAGICATIEEVLLAVKVDRINVAYGHFRVVVDYLQREEVGGRRFLGTACAAYMKPQLEPPALWPPELLVFFFFRVGTPTSQGPLPA
jgi:hypothetical protein